MFSEIIKKIDEMHEELNQLRVMVNELEEKLLPDFIANDAPIQNYVQDEPKTPDYFSTLGNIEYDEENNVKDTKCSFTLTLPLNEEAGDEYDYYVTEDNMLHVETNGRSGNATYCTTQTVDIPEDCDVDNIMHIVKDGYLVVLIPKKLSLRFGDLKKRRPTDFNYLHQKRDRKGRFVCMH